MNSNTSGSDVANIGFWPRGIWPAIIDALKGNFTQLEALVAGTQLPAAVDFIAKSGSDKISDVMMQEISRRLVVTVEKQEQGNVVFSPTAPTDKTKAWMPTDAVTGLPTDGKIRVWSEGSNEWVLSDEQGGYIPPRKRFAKVRVAAGASTVNFTFNDIQTANYFPTLTFTTQNADNTWNAPPGSYPAGFGYLITGQTNTTCSVSFFGVPTGGMMAHLQVEQIP